ncbi:hypothetical protein DdX_08139 [Ditylenchus destructor]|uniref:Uncharacterized protein n=1 Tax=Ditylenchus destructor TaxID=166010 RepID=A0AAD4N896_9BILA|nr:hypothetical protein DdX_08139 [Ditylenchus destructor]
MEVDICLRDLLNLEHVPTDVDAKFIDSFIDLYLQPLGVQSLKKLENFYRASENRSEVLLAFYIEVLRKMAQSAGATAFESKSTLNFLHDHEDVLLSSGSATLQQLVFGLLADMETLEMPLPFKFDLPTKIHSILAAERTNIYVRRAAENLAMLRLENMRKRKEDSTFLVWNLAESVLEADYPIVLDSISRVLLNFWSQLSAVQCDKLLAKAKNMRKIGLPFARLVAIILARSPYANMTSLPHGFCDSHTHAAIMSELIEYNRDLKKFDESELLDQLIKLAGHNFNMIAPHLKSMQFSSDKNACEFLRIYIPSLPNSRFFSNRNIGMFAVYLRKFDKDVTLLPSVLDALIERIKTSPSLLIYFADANNGANVEPSTSYTFSTVFEKCPLFRDYISTFVTKVLFKDLDEMDWEDRDSALEILDLCGFYLDCDLEQLLPQLFLLASSDENQFIRSGATKCLQNIFTRNRVVFNEDFRTKLQYLEAVENLENDSETQGNSKDFRSEIEDIIASFNHNCGMDDCVSKECY